MSAPAKVYELVERFHRHQEAYRSASYKEAQLRTEFLNPLFIALGWDVYNESGYAELYKDVVHEDVVKVEGAPKAPDYAFRVGGQKKFFAEAKKPSVNIREGTAPAFQLRRYAWSAKLPLSILTDFEEWSVYDCRVKPTQTDAASKARIQYLRYESYADEWDEIANVFSKEAILLGSFDRFADTSTHKRGTAEVDDTFLREMERWRDILAKNIALRNPSVSVRELNFAVQATIDRIVFLRICEDRGIESYGALREASRAKGVYGELMRLFWHADQKYNSGLFHFDREAGRVESPDILTPNLDIDDKPLRDVLGGLYYPDSPFDFRALPAAILGQVYERFLGRVIRLTSGHHAVVEEKPEVRKAGGVYYTPAYVVEYILEQTLSAWLKGKNPEAVASLRVLDPACGSGSFLLGAYQHLLDWHLQWYVDNRTRFKKKYRDRIREISHGQWRLTTAEKKRILVNNLYGVDLDAQAVEVTKLSLLLKVLEGETNETIGAQLRLFAERALPDLASNVRVGNSLVSSDYYQDSQVALLNGDTQFRVNPFDWDAEFPDVFDEGKQGFDVVIGNPPYVLLEDEFRDNDMLAYFKARFDAASFKVDLYHLFIEQAIMLCAPGGRVSMITPSNFLTNNHLAGLRRLLLERTQVESVVVVDGGVFSGASVDNAIFVVIPGKPSRASFALVHAVPEIDRLDEVTAVTAVPSRIAADPHALFTSGGGGVTAELLDRLQSTCYSLGDLADVNFGKQLRNRKLYPDDVVKLSSLKNIPKGYRPCYTGQDVRRYTVTWNGLACLESTVAQCGGCWDASKQNGKNKLLTRQIGRHPEFAIDEAGFQCLNTMFMVSLHPDAPDPYALLAILNSTLIRALWLARYFDQRRTFPKIKGTYLKLLPVYPRTPVAPDLAKLLGSLGRRAAEVTGRLDSARTPSEETALARQLVALEKQIDHAIYRLFALSSAEIEHVRQQV